MCVCILNLGEQASLIQYVAPKVKVNIISNLLFIFSK